VLEIASEAFQDAASIFDDPDPFTVRFHVNPRVVLQPEVAIPIFEPEVWNHLSETRGAEVGSSGWTGYFRSSLRPMAKADGEFLVSLLFRQSSERKPFPYSPRDRRQLARKLTVRALNRSVTVEVPEEEEDDIGLATAPAEAPSSDIRQSVQMQAKVAQIGAEMGFRIWVPRGDRVRVLEHVPERQRSAFLEVLPLNYDDTTLRTIENIDVIWLKGRSMSRAFEIEHTTAVYSGLLRMADLLALQPNMNIHLHIVAPDDKREKVLREIRRPVFSLLERGPLYDSCTFISYASIYALAKTPHLLHMSDSIIEEYEESAED
jgi:hypothetical protein